MLQFSQWNHYTNSGVLVNNNNKTSLFAELFINKWTNIKSNKLIGSLVNKNNISAELFINKWTNIKSNTFMTIAILQNTHTHLPKGSQKRKHRKGLVSKAWSELILFYNYLLLEYKSVSKLAIHSQKYAKMNCQRVFILTPSLK